MMTGDAPAGIGRGAISQVKATAAARAADFDAAYRSLRADSSIQFALPEAPPPTKPPAWVEAVGAFFKDLFQPVGRFLNWIGSMMPDAPFARILLWSIIALAAIALVVLLVRRIREGHWNWRWRKRPVLTQVAFADDWHPDASPVRAWLEEADGLAVQGRFADAIHCLLLRSIDDLASRRPQLGRPSLTGRELSQSPLLPPVAQGLFSSIAGIVERSLFGRRSVDEDQWLEARQSYSEFAQAGVWRS